MSQINQSPITQDLNDLTLSSNTTDTIDFTSYGTTSNTGYTYSISPSITLGQGLTGGPSPNAIWTTTGTGTGWGSAIGANIRPSGKLSLQGDNADIDINGKSMAAWMEKVEERLNILTPNPELEKEWDELRKLGEKYRKLEKKCKEKAEVWKRLSAKPAKD